MSIFAFSELVTSLWHKLCVRLQAWFAFLHPKTDEDTVRSGQDISPVWKQFLSSSDIFFRENKSFPHLHNIWLFLWRIQCNVNAIKYMMLFFQEGRLLEPNYIYLSSHATVTYKAENPKKIDQVKDWCHCSFFWENYLTSHHKKFENRATSLFWVRALFLTFPHEKNTLQWSKVVSEAIFPTN